APGDDADGPFERDEPRLDALHGPVGAERRGVLAEDDVAYERPHGLPRRRVHGHGVGVDELDEAGLRLRFAREGQRAKGKGHEERRQPPAHRPPPSALRPSHSSTSSSPEAWRNAYRERSSAATRPTPWMRSAGDVKRKQPPAR